MVNIALLFIDPALGRLDHALLSDQALMEMLIDGMHRYYIKVYQDDTGNFLDACDWCGIECEDDRVLEISLNYYKFSKTPFPFDFIPPLVTFFEAHASQLTGTLDASNLPQNLQHFHCSTNKLEGTLCWKDLPRGLEDIIIGENAFYGSCLLSDLPRSTIDFIADGNKFSGEIFLDALPPELENLWLHKNKLSGPIRIGKLPASIKTLDLSCNAFTGDFVMLSAPQSLQRVNIAKNAMSTNAVFAKGTNYLHIKLMSDGIASVVDEEGNTFESGL